MRAVPINLVTATGISIPATPAPIGRRTVAWFLDQMPFIILNIVAHIGVGIFKVADSQTILAFMNVVVSGLGPLAYHIYFEFLRDGRTPGKRIMGIRVVDRSGGPVRIESSVLRNLIRSWEILGFFLLFLDPSAAAIFRNSPHNPILIFASLLFAPVLITLPFWNRHALRAGDLASHTMVIEIPRPLHLRRDLAASAGKSRVASVRAGNVSVQSMQFTEAQLDVYGIEELQLLENLLRNSRRNQMDGTLREVERMIKTKIGWIGADSPVANEFLIQFYSALRAHLESRMVLGRAKKSSRDRSKPARGSSPPPGGDSN